MESVKISLITVTYNAARTLQTCIDSVMKQSFKQIEYIVIDGNSSDNTCDIIRANIETIQVFKSEPDRGIYDAMNKGIQLATGNVIGILNADDYFADEQVLSNIAQKFEQHNIDMLYADLDYVNEEKKVTRKWRSGKFSSMQFNFGWMPPHPTFYAKKECFDRFGLYKLDYGTAADYELMLRFMHKRAVNVFYLHQVTVKMRTGGVSNHGFKNRINAWKGDLKAMKYHHLLLPMLTIVLKPIRKITQFYI